MISKRSLLLLVAGLLAACIAFGSTLPAPKTEDGSAGPLPGMMDASASYTDTGAAAPAATTSHETGAAIQTNEPAGLNSTVASGEFSPGATIKGAPGPNHTGCVPEPVSVMLMTSGLLGLLAARRFRK